MLSFLFDNYVAILAILFIAYYGMNACVMAIESIRWTRHSTSYLRHSKADTFRSVYGFYWVVACLAVWATFVADLHVNLQIAVTFVAIAALIAKFFHTLYFFRR